jgi:hypothetical protein
MCRSVVIGGQGLKLKRAETSANALIAASAESAAEA